MIQVFGASLSMIDVSIENVFETPSMQKHHRKNFRSNFQTDPLKDQKATHSRWL